MTATVIHVRSTGTSSVTNLDHLEVACTTCWPLSDGHQVFGPTWKPEQRIEAEAAAARHNTARHPQAAEAAA